MLPALQEPPRDLEGPDAAGNRSLQYSKRSLLRKQPPRYSIMVSNWDGGPASRYLWGPVGWSDRDWRNLMRVAGPPKGLVAQLSNPADASAKHWTYAVPQKEVARKGSQQQTFLKIVAINTINTVPTQDLLSRVCQSFTIVDSLKWFPCKSDPKIRF